jgi:hypothetical protein
MQDEQQQPTVPFLLSQADKVTDNQEPVEDIGQEDAEIFHTRCGHPRHRDD